MTQNTICAYCNKVHTTLQSDVVCSPTIKKHAPGIALKEMAKHIVFETNQTPKKKYLKLSIKMKKGIRKMYKNANS